MIESVIDFKNYTLKISSSDKSSEAIILFHGFPAEPVTDPSKEKNIDLARYLAKNLNSDVFIHHYSGLGRSQGKEFNFINSVEDSIELINYISKYYDHINLIGHSWGGLVAINCLDECPRIRKSLLLSPFNLIPENKILEPVLNDLMKEIPHLLEDKSINDYLSEFDVIRRSYCPREKMKHLKSEATIFILQALDDNEVSLQSTLDLIKISKKDINIDILETDHAFKINREILFKKTLEFLK
ncbi:MAG: alpha/beta hydrolase [Bacteriovoracaceae bacterium]